ncbi:hypothetical protein I4U23_015754 [Adineta vaga]|nr:hypothetical protein I4U23_015754 [Adineta vaga]
MALSKVLLIWLSPMPDEIVNRFTNVSSNLPELIQYVATNVITTNSFHLIIPSDYLEDLLKNPIYKFSQIQRIDVYCDDFDALFEIQHRFNLHGDERIQFHLIRDIPQYLNRITCDNILIQEGSINQHMINALVSSIEDRIIAKKSVISLRHSQILKKFPASNLNGFPVKNSGKIHVCFMCTSCNLMSPQLYRLSCGHRTCSNMCNDSKRFAQKSLQKAIRLLKSFVQIVTGVGY